MTRLVSVIFGAFGLSLLPLPWKPVVAGERAWPDLLDVPPSYSGGGASDAAVIIAIEDYPFLPKVRGAVLNGEAWVRYLRESRQVPQNRVFLLKNREAVAEAIIAKTSTAASLVGKGGVLWVLFIGHGAPSSSPEAKEVYLAGVEAQSQPDLFFGRSVSRTKLIEAMSGVPGEARRVLILDACFTGEDAEGRRVVEGQFIPTNLSPVEGVTVLSATAAGQVAGPLPRTRGSRPGFSYLLLGGLRGWADGKVGRADGQVDLEEAVRYASDAFMVLGTGQSPSLTGPNAIRVSARERGPELQLIEEPVVQDSSQPQPPPPPPTMGPNMVRPPAASPTTTQSAPFDTAEAAKRIRSKKEQISRCLATGNLELDTLTLELSVDRTGRVRRFGARGIPSNARAFTCVSTVVRAIDFGRSAGGPHQFKLKLEF